MSQQITEERPATNRCVCGCLLRDHGYIPELDKQPCRNKDCKQGGKCGNFGRGKHTKEELIAAGIMEA